MTFDLETFTKLLDDLDDVEGAVAWDYYLTARQCEGLRGTCCCKSNDWVWQPWPWYICRNCFAYSRADSLVFEKQS